MELNVQVQRLLLHAFIIAGIVLMLYPILWMLVSSFKPTETILTDNSLWPSHLTLANYVKGWKGTSGTLDVERFLQPAFVLEQRQEIHRNSCSSHVY
ncbi:ABC transporter permease family protein [Paenibacillus gyeongsangnamensis]|uniref:hypothetical protein n=1 Tax=Paenibacillus gyeongsangnamensis TaxID=3388067 RepID=UPI002FD1293B